MQTLICILFPRSIRKFFLGTPLLGAMYRFARRRYYEFVTTKAGKRYFRNFADYRTALHEEGDGTVDIRTVDGLVITIRRNIADARVLQEVFLANPYVPGLSVRPNLTVVDIGGTLLTLRCTL